MTAASEPVMPGRSAAACVTIRRMRRPAARPCLRRRLGGRREPRGGAVVPGVLRAVRGRAEPRCPEPGPAPAGLVRLPARAAGRCPAGWWPAGGRPVPGQRMRRTRCRGRATLRPRRPRPRVDILRVRDSLSSRRLAAWPAERGMLDTPDSPVRRSGGPVARPSDSGRTAVLRATGPGDRARRAD